MKKIKLFLTLFFVVISLTAQEEVTFKIIDEAPVFPGCEKGTESQKKSCLNKKLQKHIQRYFDSELANELDLDPGKKTIYVKFKIDIDGTITDIVALAPHPKLRKEAIRVSNKIPTMKPGKQKGKAVRVSYTLPITFIVEESKEIKITKDSIKINKEKIENSHNIEVVKDEEVITKTTSNTIIKTLNVLKETTEESDIKETIIKPLKSKVKASIDSTKNNIINPKEKSFETTLIKKDNNFIISSFFKKAYEDGNIKIELKIDKGNLHALVIRKNNSKNFEIKYNNSTIRNSDNVKLNFQKDCSKSSSQKWKSLKKITTNKKYFISPLYCSKTKYFKGDKLKIVFNYDGFDQETRDNGITVITPKKVIEKIKQDILR